ncbi:MAG: FHA domain-containing protein [Planctomycetes bacterium]|nr:FHA domain-containing protein [Planctomycetota bacterium]
MSLRLVVVEGESLGVQLRLQHQNVVEVGRSAAADLKVNDNQIADIHLKVYREGERYTCFDVTGQGFLHNGERTVRAEISIGDTITIGDHKLRLLSDEASELPTAGRDLSADVPAGESALLCLKGNDAGRSFPVGGKSVQIIGRGASTDITIWDIRSSRAHCRIDKLPDGYRISDLNSSNGTTVNGTRITSHQLVDGDEVQIGSTLMRFRQA